jgi:hypothetical protein
MVSRRMIVPDPLLTGLVNTLAKGASFVFAPHPSAALQFQHDEFHKISDARWRHNINQIESLDIGFLDPSLQVVSYRRRRADHNRSEARNAHEIGNLTGRPTPRGIRFGEVGENALNTGRVGIVELTCSP